MREKARMAMIFAGDEAGDVSFAFDKGASTHFVLALVGTDQPETLRQTLATVRAQRNLPDDYEFKFHKLSSKALRLATFSALLLLDFDVWALSVDKRQLPDYWRGLAARDLYAVLVAELILLVPIEYREGNTLLLDEFDPRDRALLALKQNLKRRGVRRGFRIISSVRSRSEPLVQVADLVAGSLLRSLTYNDSETLSAIRSHIRVLTQFEAT